MNDAAAAPIYLLEVPSATRHLPTGRAFAASVGRRHALDEETIADVKLAVSEAMTEALGAGADHITLTAETNDGVLVFTIGPIPADAEESPLGGIELVLALFPRSQRHGSGIRITVELP